MNGSNLTFFMTLLIFMKQSKEDMISLSLLLPSLCMSHFKCTALSLYIYIILNFLWFRWIFVAILCCCLLFLFCFFSTLFWISGNHNHLYALRTPAEHAIFIRQCATLNEQQPHRQTKHESKMSETRIYMHRTHCHSHTLMHQIKKQNSAAKNYWNRVEMRYISSNKNERHERIITVIFIGKQHLLFRKCSTVLVWHVCGYDVELNTFCRGCVTPL